MKTKCKGSGAIQSKEKTMSIIYEDNLVTLLNGDCIEQMEYLIKRNNKINKIITSPPYNIIRPNSKDRGYDIYKDGMSNDEYIRWTIQIFKKYDKLLQENGCIIYNMSYGTENTEVMNLTIAEILKSTPFTLADILIWKKNSATPNNVSQNKMTRICEFVYVFCRRKEFNTFTANKKLIGYRDDTKQAIYENVFNFLCFVILGSSCRNDPPAAFLQFLNKSKPLFVLS